MSRKTKTPTAHSSITMMLMDWQAKELEKTTQTTMRGYKYAIYKKFSLLLMF
jgi:hypothetical protein